MLTHMHTSDHQPEDSTTERGPASLVQATISKTDDRKPVNQIAETYQLGYSDTAIQYGFLATTPIRVRMR